MRRILLLTTALVFSCAFYSQQLLYTSEFGGENHNGAIISYDPASGQTSNMLSLGGNPFFGFQILQNAVDPDYAGGLMLGSDGMYYGIKSVNRHLLQD